jgi:hypothetical protein
MKKFDDLVNKLLQDSTLADQMHDKKTRRAALKSFYGTDPIPAGLEAELDKVDFDPISNVRSIMQGEKLRN